MVAARWSTVSGLHAAVNAGLVGGVVLTAAQLLVLPNLAVFALAWLAGPGFQIADGSTITLAGAHPGLMPMIPVLGALPSDGAWSGWLILLLSVPVLAGGVIGWLACRSLARLSSWRTKLATALAAVVTSAAGLTVLAALGSGAVGVDGSVPSGLGHWCSGRRCSACSSRARRSRCCRPSCCCGPARTADRGAPRPGVWSGGRRGGRGGGRVRVIVVGGGIVGLATARALARRGDEVTVLEKETALARHQTGRNSGVIHSGIYYPPGSLKATMAVRGAASMTAFARERGIPVETTGKLVVATSAEEVPGCTSSPTAPPRTASRPGSSPRTRPAATSPTSPASRRCASRRRASSTTARSASPTPRTSGPAAGWYASAPGSRASTPTRGAWCGSARRPATRSRRTPWWSARACTPTSWPGPAGSSRRRGSCRSGGSTSSWPSTASISSAG